MEARGLCLTTIVGLVLLFGTGMVYGGAGCIPATGEIICIPAIAIVDGETITISDTIMSETLEFELASNGVSIGNTPVVLNSADTISDVASAIANAINLGSLSVSALSSGNKVMLTQGVAGPSGNIPILETVANSSFFVSGFSGGRCPEIPSVPVLPIGPAIVAGAASVMLIVRMRRRG